MKSTVKIPAKKTANKKAVIKKVSKPLDLQTINPLLHGDMIDALKYFGEYENERREHLGNLRLNAFLYGPYAGLSIMDGDNALLKNIPWTVQAKKDIIKILDCIDAVISLAVALTGNDSEAIKYKSTLAFMNLDDISSNEDIAGPLMGELFETSIIYAPLYEMSANSYEMSAYSEMWNNMEMLITAFIRERHFINKAKADKAYKALLALGKDVNNIAAPDEDGKAHQTIVDTGGNIWDIDIDYVRSTDTYIFAIPKTGTPGKIDHDRIRRILSNDAE